MMINDIIIILMINDSWIYVNTNILENILVIGSGRQDAGAVNQFI